LERQSGASIVAATLWRGGFSPPRLYLGRLYNGSDFGFYLLGDQQESI